MHFRCPNCNHAIEVLETVTQDVSTDQLTCPTCKSKYSLSCEQTTTFDPKPGMTIAHFEVRDVLGEGAFGTVYRAYDTQLDREVAIKIPRGGQQASVVADRQFLKEARSAAGIKNSHVVQVYEVGKHEASLYIACEFIDGITLGQWFRDRRLALEDAASLAVTICEAVQAAHDAGVIHRDLKPGNILMDQQGQPHVADFGLSKRDNPNEITVSRDGHILGTPAYMSPEQARGDVQGTTRLSDVYSIGVILYEMVTGRRPFVAADSRTVMHRILTEAPPAPRTCRREIPRDLETIILKAMSKEPQRRYGSASAMADDLRRFLDNRPIQARRVGPLKKTALWGRRNPVVAVLALVALLFAIALGMTLWRDPGRPSVAKTHQVQISYSLRGANVPANTIADWLFLPLDEVRRPIESRGHVMRNTNEVQIDLKPGEYLVSIHVAGFGFHEVYRTVPEDLEEQAGNFRHNRWQIVEGRIKLPEIVVAADSDTCSEMALIEGDVFVMGIDGHRFSPKHDQSVQTFYIDRHEVTCRDFDRVFDLPPIYQQADAPPRGDAPVVGVSWHQAVAYAEAVGKRLPTEAEHEFCATNRGTSTYPWGDEVPAEATWQLAEVNGVTFDVNSQLGIRGLCSNAAEWTSSLLSPYPGGHKMPASLAVENRQSRVFRGGPAVLDETAPHFSVTEARERRAADARLGTPNLGFRCARHATPRKFPQK